jgi:hypothetical protein
MANKKMHAALSRTQREALDILRSVGSMHLRGGRWESTDTPQMLGRNIPDKTMQALKDRGLVEYHWDHHHRVGVTVTVKGAPHG